MARVPADQYVTKVRMPEDIDRFWDDILAETAQIPLEPEVVYDSLRSTARIDVYEVFFTSLDHVRIAGWYAVPRQHDGPLPGLIQVPGYNMEPPVPKTWAAKGYAAFSVAPPRQAAQQPAVQSPATLACSPTAWWTGTPTPTGAFTWTPVGPLTSCWDGMKVNGDRIGVTGHSQGGGLTVSTAALRPEIKAAAAGAPYLCGYMDSIDLTDAYPYQEIADYLRMYPDSREQVENTLAYFDGINWPTGSPARSSSAWACRTAPARRTGFTMFDAVASEDKKMYAYDGHGHDANNHEHGAVVDAFMAKHLQD